MSCWHSRRLFPVAIAACMVCSVTASRPVPAQSIDAATSAADSTKLRILFPAYANPSTPDGLAMWKKFADLSRHRPAGLEIELIFNPASGPGQRPDPNYLRADGTGPLADVQGLRVYGYVTTSYAKRTLEEVQNEIDQYASGFYSGFVSGIFFDETSSDLNSASYYRALSEYARNAIRGTADKPAMTVSNPGIGEVQPPVTNPGLQSYATAMDRTVVFEHEAARYHDNKPALVKPFLSADRLVHIVHTQPTWTPSLVSTMQNRGVANIFITDATMPNPYNRLPTYFDELCAQVAALNQAQ